MTQATVTTSKEIPLDSIPQGNPVQESPQGPGKRDRLIWVDFLRGIAIMLMIPANLSPYYAEPHAMGYRFLSSLAAPMFICLSAGMVILNSQKHPIGYYLTRGGAVMLIGVFLDGFVWRVLPFASVDVLYVIGLSLPVMYLIRGQKIGPLIATSGILMLGGPVLQALVGYQVKVLEIKFSAMYIPDLSRVVSSWFVDGYFPLLPWLGYAFMGAALFQSVSRTEGKDHTIVFFVIGLIFLGVGSLLLFVPTTILPNLANGGILVSREGYSEIFYPPTVGFLFFANGTILIEVAVFMKVKKGWWSVIPTFYGRYSMLVYISHQALGEYALKPVLGLAGMEQVSDVYAFLLINLLMFLIVALLCKAADRIKKSYPPRNVFLQVILGK